MKFLHLKDLLTTSISIVSSATVLFLVGGCSGGGGAGGTSSIKSTLDTQSVETLASHLAVKGDCTAISGVLQAGVAVYNNAVVPEQTGQAGQLTGQGSYPISSTVYGLTSGTLSKEGEHNNGTDTLVYTFNNFTNPVGNLQVDINGKASVVDHGKPGDYGPIKTNKTIDTVGALDIAKSSSSPIKANSSSTSSTHYSVSISGYNQTYATKLLDPDSLVIKSATIKDSDSNTEYKLTSFNAKGYFTDDTVTLSKITATYTDPDVGTLKVSGDHLNINRDAVVKVPTVAEGTFTLTATDKTQADVTIDASGNVKFYSVDDTGKTLVSELDCSNLVN